MAILASGSAAQEIGYVVSLIVVNFFGMIANALVVAMFIRYRRRLLAKPKNLFLFSMTVADFGVGICGILGGILFHLQATGVSTVTMYKIFGLLPLFGSFFISIISLGTLTADRLISIKYAVKYTSVMNRKMVRTLIACTWVSVTAIIIVLGVLFFTVSKQTELMARGLLLGIFFVLSSIVLSVSNGYLYLTLREIAKKKAEQGESYALDSITTDQYNSTNEANKFQMRKSQNKKYAMASEGSRREKPRSKRSDAGNSMICVWMTVLFIGCWFPAAVYYVTWAITGHAPAGRWLLAFCLSLASANSLSNPCIYFAKRKDFRAYLLKLVKVDNSTTSVANREQSSISTP